MDQESLNFLFTTQRLLGLSMEDPTPPLDTPEVVGVSKPGGLKALNQSGASGHKNRSFPNG